MDDDVRDLLLRERDSRATDLRFYRGLAFAVLAGAGTVFFGLMLIYGRLFVVGATPNISQTVLGMLEALTLYVPILGMVSQAVVTLSLLHIHSRIRVTIYQLQKIHRQFGVEPEVDVPWSDPLKVRRAQMQDGNWWFFFYQLPYLIPNVMIFVIWSSLLHKALFA